MKHIKDRLIAGLVIALFSLPFLLFSEKCHAQEPANGIFPLKDGRIIYEKIVLVDSISKDELYKRIKIWSLKAFNSQKSALQTEDKDIGLIGYKSFITEQFESPEILGASTTSKWQYWFIIKFYTKDGKVKIVIDELELKGDNSGLSSSAISILSYRNDTEQAFKKGMLGKKYRERYYEAARNNFISADAHINTMISSIEKALKEKSETDF